MKKIVAFCVISATIVAMENPPKKTVYTLMPKDVAAHIATMVQKDAVEHITVKTDWGIESFRMSNTWNTLEVVEGNIFDHQMWVRGRSMIRFDNDVVHDCNEFNVSLEKDDISGLAPRVDGPNHDGGEHHGVIVVGRSIKNESKNPEQDYDAIFHLFKLHGIASKLYDGPIKKRQTDRAGAVALSYTQFPYTSVVKDEKLSYIALSRKNMIAMATTRRSAEAGFNILRLFQYKIVPDPIYPTEHSFETSEVAACTAPSFKKLCWVYGKNILGLCEDGTVYVVSYNNGSLRCNRQHIPLHVKDIAVHQPVSQHEVIFCDKGDNLYYANLANNCKGKIPYYCFCRKTDDNPVIDHDVDRLWYYNNKIGVLHLKSGKTTITRFGERQTCQTPEGVYAWLEKHKKRNENNLK